MQGEDGWEGVLWAEAEQEKKPSVSSIRESGTPWAGLRADTT